MVTVKFRTGNAAFMREDESIDLDYIASVLEKVADDIRNGYTDKNIMDINGNKVGYFNVEV